MTVRKKFCFVSVFLASFFATGCTTDPEPPDKTTIDAKVSGTQDAAVPDAAIPDAAIPDAPIPDAAIPDAQIVYPDAGW